MKRYKLTDQNMKTYGGCQWVIGEKKTTSGEGRLCGPGWLHCYTHPLLAMLLNPIHANIENPRLFEIEAGGDFLDDHGLKEGFTKMTLIRELPVPDITQKQRISFGILCAKEVCKDAKWNKWADAWLSGEDRSKEAAEDAARAARAARAAWAAARAAARAAEAAARAAARAAEDAAWAAARAAEDAAWAAEHDANIDLIKIVEQAIKIPGPNNGR